MAYKILTKIIERGKPSIDENGCRTFEQTEVETEIYAETLDFLNEEQLATLNAKPGAIEKIDRMPVPSNFESRINGVWVADEAKKARLAEANRLIALDPVDRQAEAITKAERAIIARLEKANVITPEQAIASRNVPGKL